ncbi:MAG: SIS domain-containing protein, partial [Candidatus Baldrarchaeia archaeon]
KVLEIWARGKSTLEKMFSTMFIGDMTTLYLAFLRNVDPLKIELIEKLKKELERKGTKQKILQKLLAVIEKENKITFSRKVR